MKKYLLIILMLCTLTGFAQNEPLWVNSAWRQAQYPHDTFLTGFSQDVKTNDETVAKATERVKNLAVGDLAKNVIATIQSVSESYAQSIEYGNNEQLKKTFETQTKAETNAQINGISVDVYYNPKTNYAYAFAHANRNEVIGYYKAQISMHIQQIEGYVATAEAFKQKAEIAKAETEYNKTAPLFAQIEYAQGLLTAVDKNADEASLQIQKSIDLKNKVVQAISDLKQGISVLINYHADMFGTTTYALEDKIKAALSQSSCHFVYEQEQADWIVTINAKARQYNEMYGTYFAFVDATVNIERGYNQQHVYQNSFEQKGGSALNFNDAATKAYTEIADKINEQLLKYIK